MKLEQNALLFLFIFIISAHSQAANKTIKVLIGKNLKKVVISGNDIKSYLHLVHKSQTYAGEKKLAFNCSGKVTKIRKNKTMLLATINSLTGTLAWKGRRYRGKITILWPKNASGCEIVNELPMDTYISTLLAKEMNASWPMEALKAQAIAARTYAYHKITSKQVSKNLGHNAYYDIESSEKHQVSGSLSDQTNRTSKAAHDTAGQVLTLANGQLTPIFFHSKCGGKTILPGQVWQNKVKGYTSVPCPFCHKHGKKAWSLKLGANKLKNYLNQALGKYENIFISSAKADTLRLVPDKSRRPEVRFYYNDRHLTLNKSRLRAVMGRKRLPSNNFSIVQEDGQIKVKGDGYGHGVGLCQFGAFELAKRGYRFDQILSHYFPKHKLEEIY